MSFEKKITFQRSFASTSRAELDDQTNKFRMRDDVCVLATQTHVIVAEKDPPLFVAVLFYTKREG